MKLRVAKERLQFLMGRAVPAADFDIIDEPRRDPPPASLEEVERLALDLRPDLQALRYDQARSQAEIRLQLAEGKVDYMVGVGYLRQQGMAGKGNMSVSTSSFRCRSSTETRARSNARGWSSGRLSRASARWRPKYATKPATPGSSTKRRARCSLISRPTCSNRGVRC